MVQVLSLYFESWYSLIVTFCMSVETGESIIRTHAATGATKMIDDGFAGTSIRTGSRILVLHRKYFDMMCKGEKTLEVRHQCLKSGIWHVGHSGYVYGKLFLGKGTYIKSKEEWEALAWAHHHPSEDLPYKRTCVLPVSEMHVLQSVIPYKHHHGSIGTARFEPLPSHSVTDSQMTKISSISMQQNVARITSTRKRFRLHGKQTGEQAFKVKCL